MNNKNKDIEIRSDEVQEILGKTPSWLIRVGTVIVFIFVFVILFGSWFFKYPTVITSSVKIVTECPIAPVVAKNTGTISKLFVVDSQYVKKNQPLAITQNSANVKDVLELQERLPWLTKSIDNHVYSFDFSNSLQLGEVQSSFASFNKANQDYHLFVLLKRYQKEISATKSKIKLLKEKNGIVYSQFDLGKEKHILAKNEFKINEKLFNSEVISPSQFEKDKQSYIDSKNSVETIKASIVDNKILIDELYHQIETLNIEYYTEKKHLEDNIVEQFKNMESQIALWFDNYVLVSPIDGIVAFNNLWSSNQLAIKEHQIFSIIPKKTSKIIGRVTLSAKGAGRVKTGQYVNIKFDNYPYFDYGIVHAIVSSKTMVSLDGGYIVELNIPNGLVTNYNKKLPFNQQMTGTAEIMTDDVRLLERFFNPIKAFIKNNTQ